MGMQIIGDPTLNNIKTDIKTVNDKSDSIKGSTDLIGIANPTTANTATIMNYIKKLEGVLGITGTSNPASGNANTIMAYIKLLEDKIGNLPDFSKVVPFSKRGSGIGTSNQTLFSAFGRGFLSNAFIAPQDGNTGYNTSLKITIDGTVLFYGIGYNIANSVIGLFNPSMLSVTNDGGHTGYVTITPVGKKYVDVINIRQHPYNDAASNYAPVVILDNPLQFKSSLIIEGLGDQAAYSISGGLY